MERAPQIIVTADDFGRSSEVNQGVLQAHEKGILTSASLMVAGDAVEEAVALARRSPRLAVGIHVVLADGRPVLPGRSVPHLADGSGRFLCDPVRAGVRYFFSRAARRELQTELEAQFARFAATGLPLSHVDGHQHLHLHPAVLPMVLRLAERYGARGIRVPRDRLWPSLRSDRRRVPKKLLWTAVFHVLARRSLRILDRYRLSTAARTYGLMQTGRMREDYVVGLLRGLCDPSAEIYFHPAVGRRLDPFGPNPDDLESLVSPAVRRIVAERRLELCTWPALAEHRGADT